MTDPILDAVAEGEARALRQWQAEHREPCADCGWTEVQSWAGDIVHAYLADPCPRHGGTP